MPFLKNIILLKGIAFYTDYRPSLPAPQFIVIFKDEILSEELKYRPLPKIKSREHARIILASGDPEDIKLLPLAVGDQCPESDKVFAQELCLSIANSEDAATRSNAILGLAYIARRHKWLDKRLVKPYILRELRENKEFNWRIVDAIEDINQYLANRRDHQKENYDRYVPRYIP